MKNILFFAALGDLWGRSLDPSVTVQTLPAAVALLVGDDELVLRDQDRDAAFVAVLLAQPALATTTGLDLSGNPLGPDGGRVFAESAGLPALQSLDLSNTGLGDAGARALGEARLPALNSLRLDQCGVGAVGARGLARLAAQLETLSIVGTSDLWEGHGHPPFLGAQGFEALVEAPLARLVALAVPLNDLGDRGARALAHATHLVALRQVDLRGNGIGDRGAQALLDAPQLAALTELDLRDNPISAALQQALRDRYGARVRLAKD